MNGSHNEYSYRKDGVDTVVVFIHGILGSPSQFTYLIDRLGGQYAVENLLLPGHGSTIREFARSSMADWQAYVDSRIAVLEQAYRHIILVGHSMGCLLAVQASLTYPARIRGLFLLAMPLAIRVPSPAVIRRMASALNGRQTPADDIEAAGWSAALQESSSVSPIQPLYYLASLPRFAELFQKSRKTRRLLPNVTVPSFAIQSENDETVSPRSLRYLEGLPGVSLMMASGAGHFYYPAETKTLIGDALENFINHAVERNTSDALFIHSV